MINKSQPEANRKQGSVWLQLAISILMVVALDVIAGFGIIPDSYTSFRSPHYYYHHGLQPNHDGYAAWGSSLYPIKTNSLGMVDSAVYDVALKSGKARIMILGDSHSEGVGVPYEKTFSGLLAKRMNGNAEVLNASCISYSPKTEYLKSKFLFEAGLQVDHVFVLIDISDMQNELVYEKFEPAKRSSLNEAWYSTKFLLRSYSSIFYLFNSISEKRKTRKFLETAKFFNDQGVVGTPANALELYASFFRGFDDNVLLSNPQFHGVGEWYYNESFKKLADRGIQLGQENILRLKDLCERRNVRLTISVHPWHYQILKGNSNDYYVEKWRLFAEKNNIGFINLFPLFITAQNPVITSKMYYIKDDNHWNEFGHALVADRVEAYFNEIQISGIK
jgi:lysophospholipase L1-like esterase